MTKNEDWFNEIQSCKKLKKNDFISKSNGNVTTKLFECLKNKKPNREEKNFKIVDYSYQIKKNESLGIDRKTDKKLKSGKINIDLKIDFHGLTLEKAFDILLKSVERAYDNGLRCILVITGKGKGTQINNNSIKSMIEVWMQHPNISSRVIKYTDALPCDGGTGALYVLLKRKQNNIENTD
ncbi:MAG: Smr/MutS family protein [Rickettsiales bacterium]|jgi:DNA-nicking Smr family endonuclease|nr:Smr/MutS family protein [Rickettsiales bacterium]